MGTGITSILLHNLPYNAHYLYYLSLILFVLNILLFLLFIALFALKHLFYPQLCRELIRNPKESLFLGAIPPALATIVNMVVFVCVPAWGPWTIQLVSASHACEWVQGWREKCGLTSRCATGVGIMVDRRRALAWDVFLHAIHNVSYDDSRHSFLVPAVALDLDKCFSGPLLDTSR